MKTLIAVTLAAFAGATFAAGPKEDPKEGPNGPRRGMMMESPTDPIVRLVNNPKIAEKIGLSQDQKKKIAEIDAANRENAKNLQKSVRESIKKQAELLKAEKIDEAAVMAEIDKAFDARKDLAKLQTKRVIAIKAILTPEQVQQVLEILKNRSKHDLPKPDLKKDKGPKGDDPKPDNSGKPVPPKD